MAAQKERNSVKIAIVPHSPQSSRLCAFASNFARALNRRRAVVVANQAGADLGALAGFVGGAGVFHPAFALVLVVESD